MWLFNDCRDFFQVTIKDIHLSIRQDNLDTLHFEKKKMDSIHF